MNEQMTKLLELLAAKLGTTAEHLWGVLIRQARIEAVTDITFILLTIFGVYWYYRWVKSFNERNRYDDFSEMEIVGLIFGGVVSFISTIASIVCLFSIPAELFNPEYWALEKILNVLK